MKTPLSRSPSRPASASRDCWVVVGVSVVLSAVALTAFALTLPG